MKKIVFLLISVMISYSAPAQTKAAGVLIPNTLSFEGEKLVLNGVGIREKYFMDMYAGALYLKVKSSNANAITAANESMAIKLHMVSGLITSDKMIEAINEGFENSTGGNLSSLKQDIEKFKGFFKNEIKKEDVFDIVYLPTRGTIVYKNNKELGTLKGLPFKQALFGIWLANKPADKNLKAGMLDK